MSNDDQIAAIKSALAAIDSAISQSEAALRTASNPDDIRSLTSNLVDLRSERSRLQSQLDNLEASSTEVQAIGGSNQMKALGKQLDAAITDRSVVRATLKFSGAVKAQAKRLRILGGG
jgi:hypothetical protein